MPQGARVDSLETLKAFKAALWKFQEAAQVALGDAEADVNRMLMWVQGEQDSFWQGQIRKRQEAVVRCKEAVRMKTVFKDASGRQQSAVDEQKALQIAIKKLAEAEAKLVLVKRWARQLQKEIEMYKGGVQRFATSVHSEIPNAAAHLERLAANLDAYLSVQPASSGNEVGLAGGGGTGSAGAMSRGGEAALAKLPIPPIPEIHQIEIGRLMFERQPPGEEATILLCGVKTGSDGPVGLRREENGWKLDQMGVVLESTDQISIPVRAALQERPELADLLSLPVGFSVIIDQAGIVEVLDPRSEAVWRRPGPGN